MFHVYSINRVGRVNAIEAVFFSFSTLRTPICVCIRWTSVEILRPKLVEHLFSISSIFFFLPWFSFDYMFIVVWDTLVATAVLFSHFSFLFCYIVKHLCQKSIESQFKWKIISLQIPTISIERCKKKTKWGLCPALSTAHIRKIYNLPIELKYSTIFFSLFQLTA